MSEVPRSVVKVAVRTRPRMGREGSRLLTRVTRRLLHEGEAGHEPWVAKQFIWQTALVVGAPPHLLVSCYQATVAYI